VVPEAKQACSSFKVSLKDETGFIVVRKLWQARQSGQVRHRRPIVQILGKRLAANEVFWCN
jgi:hypothetical protein